MKTSIDDQVRDDPLTDGRQVEILIQATADGQQGFLVLAPIAGGDVLEIPITKQDASQMIAALAEFVWPGCRLRSAMPAGQA